MPVKISKERFEGKWAVYHRPSGKVKFFVENRDDRDHLSIGQVSRGVVAGQRIERFFKRKRVGC